MSERKKSVMVRLTPEVLEALQRWAAEELRSVNGQIEYVLRDAVRRRTRGRGPLHEDEHEARIAVFGTAWPHLKAVMDELVQLGLTDWARRLEAGVSFGGSPAEIIANMRATLVALQQSPVILPGDVARLVRLLEAELPGREGTTEGAERGK